MANWATNQDVVDTWVGDDKPNDIELIDALIEKAETIILASFPKIQDRIDAGTISSRVIKLVIVNMVERGLRNPSGKTSYSYTAGPFAESGNYATARGMWLSDEEKLLLSPNTFGKAFSIDLKAGSNKVYNNEGTTYTDSYIKDSLWVEVDREDF